MVAAGAALALGFDTRSGLKNIVQFALDYQASSAFFDALAASDDIARRTIRKYEDQIYTLKREEMLTRRARRGEAGVHEIIGSSLALEIRFKIIKATPDLDVAPVNDKGEQLIHVMAQ
jgi:hypothetical protein